MDGTAINSCSGFFMDSGANDAYGINEDFTTVICSDGTGQRNNVRLNFNGLDLGMGDSIFIYDGNSVAAPLFDRAFLVQPNQAFSVQATVTNPSGCITIVFRSDAIDENNQGWAASIECTQNCQTILAELGSSTPTVSPVDTGYIDICPGETIMLTGNGIFPQNGIRYNQSDANSTFLWDFGDGYTGTGQTVSHQFNEPGGYTIELSIVDQDTCRNSNFISQRVRVAPPPNFAVLNAFDTTLCQNDTISITSTVEGLAADANIGATNNEERFRQPLGRPDTIFLPDGQGAFYNSSLLFNQFNIGGTITDPEQICGITINLEHSYAGDLGIEIICPNGQSTSLMSYIPNGGLGSINLGSPFACAASDPSDDMDMGIPFSYMFVNSDSDFGPIDMAATQTDTYTYCMPSYTDDFLPEGSYEPTGTFSSLVGCPLNGEWQIIIQDNINRDNGWLFGWSMCFADSLFQNTETFTPNFTDYGWENHPTVIEAVPDSITASSMSAGPVNYTFWTEDDFGCRADTSLRLEVLPITHPECLNCDVVQNIPLDTLLCEGESLDLDVTVNDVLDECIPFTNLQQNSVQGPTILTEEIRSTLSVNSMLPLTITNVLNQLCEVCIDVPSNTTPDLRIDLIAPDGTIITLAQGLLGTEGYRNTCFTTSIAPEIRSGGGIYRGSFFPQEDWADLNGTPINGDWTLVVSGNVRSGDFFALENWSISFLQTNAYTHTWQPAGDFPNPNSAQVRVSPTTNTSYQVTTTDLYGCTDQDQLNVQVVNELPPPILMCSEDGAEITVSWSPIAGVSNYEFNLTRDGMEQGWQTTANTSITVNGLSNGDVISVGVRADLASSGIDCPVMADTIICTSTFCGLAASPVDIDSVSCFGLTDGGASIQINSGTAPFSYELDGGGFSADSVFTNLAGGTHSIVVTDAANCTINFDFEVPAPDSLNLDITQTDFACYGESDNATIAQYSGGSGSGYVLNWNDPLNQTADVATNLPPGILEVTLADSRGCETSQAFEVSTLDSIIVNILAVRPTCAGLNNGFLGINRVEGGAGTMTGDYTFVWSNNQSTDLFQTDLLGDSTYYVTITDNQGCQSVGSRFLPDGQGPQNNATVNDPSCNGFLDGAILLTDLSSPNGSNFTFSWSDSENQSTNPVVNLEAGTYFVTITDDSLCTSIDTFQLIEPQLLSLDVSKMDNECFGDRSGSIDLTTSGGTTPYSFAWSNNAITEDLDRLPAGEYQVDVMDANGCEVSTTVTIEQPITITAEVSSLPVLCFGEENGSISVTVDGGSPPFQYSLDNQIYSSNSTFIGLSASQYNVYVRDVNGCVLRTTIEVGSPGPISVNAGPDLTINFGESIQLLGLVENAQGDVNYVWSPPYTDSTLLSCFFCRDPFASPEFTGDFTILVFDENGCEAEDIVRVIVEKPRLVAVPTGFTPNKDMANDILLVHGRPGTMVDRFSIFDRWGEQIFTAENFDVNNPTVGWDGTFRDRPMNGGVYLWTLEVVYEDGSTETLRGQTTLIR